MSYKMRVDILTEAVKETYYINGVPFNHAETLKRIQFYRFSQYMERNDDAIFWNIINPRIVHFSKLIDLDTKDLQPEGQGEVSFVQTWILKMKFYKWLRENKVALTLNDLSEGIAARGSHVWKVTKKDGKQVLETAELRNLYFNPLCKSLRETDVVEKHYFTEYELRKMTAWDSVQEVIETKKEELQEKYDYSGNQEYEICEYFGEYYDEETDTVDYRHAYVYVCDEKEIILFEEQSKPEKSPYYDFHVSAWDGRWLRVGVAERLFKLQERANQLVNQNKEASDIASLLLLRTQDAENLGNVLTDVENGQVIHSDDLQQIGISNNGLNQFIAEMQLIERQADSLALTPQIITGDALPSGTPFRSVAVLANTAKSAFRFIRERIGEEIGYLLENRIFPDVVKEWQSEDIIEIATDEADVRIYDQTLRRQARWDFYVNKVLSGEVVTLEQLEALDRTLDQEIDQVGRKLKIPENFFDFDFKIRTNITGEQVDKAQRNDAYFNALQLVQANPAIINIPLFKQYVEDNGISWWKLTQQQVQELQQQPRSTGSAQPIGSSQDKLSAAVDSE